MNGKNLAAEAIGTFWLTFVRLRQCGDRGWISPCRYWIARRGPRFRSYSAHDGLCHRTRLWVPPQSGSNCWIDVWRSISAQPRLSLRGSASGRCDHRCCGVVRHCQWIARFQPRRGICGEWLCRPFAWQLWAGRLSIDRSRADDDVSFRHYGTDPRESAGGICADRNRPCADP